jgi:hypothetical protein
MVPYGAIRSFLGALAHKTASGENVLPSFQTPDSEPDAEETMTLLEYTVLSAALSFTLFVVGHIAISQLLRQPRLGSLIIRIFVVAVLAHLGIMIAVYAAVPGAGLWIWAAHAGLGCFLMACALVLYVPFVFVVSSSLSIDMLIILIKGDKALPREQLRQMFVSAEAVRYRFELMRGNNLVVRENDRYVLTDKGRRTADIFSRVKYFWKLWPGG